MAEIFVRKIGNMLFPADVQAKEWIENQKNGDYKVKITGQRNSKFHRKYFELLNVAFDAWDVDYEIYKNFDVFRKNIAILSGFYTQAYDIKGNIVLEAKSISFSEMEEPEFQVLYTKTINVILKHVLHNYTKDDLDLVVNNVLSFD